VFSKLRDGETDFYWEHQDGKKCLHFVWNKATGQFIGLNAFGIRLRHEVFDKFLREKREIDYVLENLKSANFDPEFYAQHENEIVNSFNNTTGKNITLKKQGGLKAALAIIMGK